MSNGTDTQCCAADICCGGRKSVEALAKDIRADVTDLTEDQALRVARRVKHRYTLVPVQYGFGEAFRALADAVRAHPGYDE